MVLRISSGDDRASSSAWWSCRAVGGRCQRSWWRSRARRACSSVTPSTRLAMSSHAAPARMCWSAWRSSVAPSQQTRRYSSRMCAASSFVIGSDVMRHRRSRGWPGRRRRGGTSGRWARAGGCDSSWRCPCRARRRRRVGIRGTTSTLCRHTGTRRSLCTVQHHRLQRDHDLSATNDENRV